MVDAMVEQWLVVKLRTLDAKVLAELVMQPAMTIKDVKIKIKEKHGYPLFCQKLVHASIILDDCQSLEQFGHELTVDLILIPYVNDLNLSAELLSGTTNNDLEKVMSVLRVPVDPDTFDPDSKTPLFWAAHLGFTQITRVLCEASADLEHECIHVPSHRLPHKVLA